MTPIYIYLDNLSEAQREVCGGCSAYGQTYVEIIPFPLCKAARLEKDLGKKPTYGEAAEVRIDTTGIPEGCPNGYISGSSREIR